MGCNSVYKGLCRNRIRKDEVSKLAEIKHLAETALEPIIEQVGSISISYGFISDELSHKIVKYQDPAKPSYHRADLGAAADFIPHEWVEDKAPVLFAAHIQQHLPEYARMITYSESSGICVATSLLEKNRRALYENRYEGVQGDKPKFISYSKNVISREKQLDALDAIDYTGWKGQGFPSYHGGRKQQMHHIRTGKYSVLSDFLYSRDAVHKGIPNIPDINDKHIIAAFMKAGEAYDHIVEGFGRCAIVRAYEHYNVNMSYDRDYSRIWVLELVPPEGTDMKEMHKSLYNIDGLMYMDAMWNYNNERVTIWGSV